MVSGFVSGMLGGASVNIVISVVDRYSKELKNASDSLGKFRTAAIGVGLGMTGLIAASVKLSASFEQTNVAFTTMLGSAEEAKKLLKDLADFASKTPFTITTAEQGARQLMAYGLATKEIIPTLRMLGDVAAGLSVPLEQIVYAYGQVRAANQLYGTELRQFVNAGVPLLQELADMYGVTTSQAKKMVEEGKVSFKDTEEAFRRMTSEGGRFNNLMAEQAKTAAGLWSNLKDEITKAGRAVGSEFLEPLKAVLSTTVGIVQKFNELPEEQKKSISRGGGIAAGGALLAGGIFAGLKMVRGQTKLLPLYVEDVGKGNLLSGGKVGGAAGTVAGAELLGTVAVASAGSLLSLGAAYVMLGNIADTLKQSISGTFSSFQEKLDNLKASIALDKYKEAQLQLTNAFNEGKISEEIFNSEMEILSKQFDSAVGTVNSLRDGIEIMSRSMEDVYDRMLIQGSKGNFMTQAQASSMSPLRYTGGGKWEEEDYSDSKYVIGGKGVSKGTWENYMKKAVVNINLDGAQIGGAMTPQIASEGGL